MEKEQLQHRLKEHIINSFHDLLARNSDLAKAVQDAVEIGDFDVAEISAALQLSEGISRTVREVIGGVEEHVIFSRDHISTDQPLPQEIQPEVHLGQQQVGPTPLIQQGIVLEGVQEILGQQEKPKTFGELLVQKLDRALPEKQEFTRQELCSFTENIRGTKGIFESHGGSEFNREESIKILQEVLSSPGGNLKQKRRYSRQAIFLSFPRMQPSIFLDEWSSTIEHDWSETPEVNFEEAMQIRGLLMMGKLNLPPKPLLLLHVF